MISDVHTRGNDHDVLVAGAGPVGLMLATELSLAGVNVLVVERRVVLDTAVKAEGINAACAAAFERRGMHTALESAHRPIYTRSGSVKPRFAGHFGGIQVPADLVDADDPSLRQRGPRGWNPLQVAQVEVERILGERAQELGIEIRRGVSVCGADADDDGVTVALDGGVGLRVGWLVGCDGGRSTVRKLAGFEFVGTGPEITGRQAVCESVEGADRLRPGWQYTSRGLYVYGPMPGRIRTVEFDGPPPDRDAPLTAAEMAASLRRVSGVDVHIAGLVSGARFTDNARRATTYRRGRVLLCGDAAHVHSPFSGQGLNLGIGDAVNLGWKLAATVAGWAPGGLLDTYDSERHPIGAQVLDWTRAQVAVMRGDEASRALRGVVADFLHSPDGATYYVTRTSGLGQRYDGGDPEQTHPLVGMMAPDLELDGSRLAAHLRHGRAVLVDFTGDPDLGALSHGYAERMELIRPGTSGSELSALFVRPDGIVAWAADGAADFAGLEPALARWLGAAVNPSRRGS